MFVLVVHDANIRIISDREYMFVFFLISFNRKSFAIKLPPAFLAFYVRQWHQEVFFFTFE